MYSDELYCSQKQCADACSRSEVREEWPPMSAAAKASFKCDAYSWFAESWSRADVQLFHSVDSSDEIRCFRNSLRRDRAPSFMSMQGTC